MISFIVPTVPVSQPRPRAYVLAGHARVYAAPKSHAIHQFKASIQQAAQQSYQGSPLCCPISLRLVFVMPRPCSMMWKTKPMPRVHHTGRPDCDNICKAVKDALSKLIWRDDSQVCMVHLEKWTAAGDEQPHVEIEIEELT